MLALDRDSFICDMAETYRLFDIKSIPIRLLAVLASGLGVNSRIRLKREGLKAPWEVVLLATMVDMWSSDDNERIAPGFLVTEKKARKDTFKVFRSVEEFEKEKAYIIASSSQKERT